MTLQEQQDGVGKANPKLLGLLEERDGPGCAFCGTDADLVADHIVPTSRGGGNEASNRQLLCGGCNSRKGNQSQEEALAPLRFRSSLAKRGFTVAHNVILFSDLSSPAKILYFQLRHYAFASQFGRAFPSQEEMAAGLGYASDRALRPYLRELEEARLVASFRLGRGRVNGYTIVEPVLSLDPEAKVQDRNDSSGLTGTILPVSRERVNGNQRPVQDALSPKNGESAHTLLDQALRAACFNGTEPTPREARQSALAANELLAAGATPSSVKATASAYRRHPAYGSCALTPQALAAHYAELAPPPPAAPPCPSLEPPELELDRADGLEQVRALQAKMGRWT